MLPRRAFVTHLAAGSASLLAGCASGVVTKRPPGFRLATFEVDVTVPIGHALMGGGIAPAKEIGDRLYARGLVVLGGDKPIVIVSVEWCEIRNEAYEAWRSALAHAVGTDPERVLVSSVHVHDAPVADLGAEQRLRAQGGTASVCDPAFHHAAVKRVATGLRESLRSARRITHIGTGQAKVDQVASNRRYLLPDAKPAFGRMSTTRDVIARDAPEGVIDPWLKTLSFWDGDQPVAALHAYAVHPMSGYGQGRVSADFVGLARVRRQADDPRVFQIYGSGCSGNVVAGKYNSGAPGTREILAGRLQAAMVEAWKGTRHHPLQQASFRASSLTLAPRDDAGFSVDDLAQRLAGDEKPFGRCLAAMGLSWRERGSAGLPITVPAIDFGPAQLLLLPAEAYVEYQLFAQRQRPDSFVLTLGYGECAPGYIPTEQAWQEKDSNLHDWCWVAPGAEERMRRAIREALAR